ncbi:MAG: AraC family ligand binding domain-containing protein [Clostridia bacterium]|nr:AraC family ligand binding domain-containing protein [Clostridia bacterium]
MESDAKKISLQYGDALLSFYNIKTAHKGEGKMLWHSHRYYELHILKVGGIKYRFRDGEIDLKSGEMLIIPPNVDHFSHINRDSCEFVVVSMSLEYVDSDQKFYSVFENALNSHALKPVDFKLSDVYVLEMSELYQSVLGVLRLKHTAAAFIDRLMSSLLSNNNPQIASGKASAVLIDTLVNIDGVTIDDIAAATNYSKRHITRLIKKTYGKTLSEIRRKRIR